MKSKRRLGIPTGNAGEYFVMGELLRRGYDAQLADRNTKGYDILVGRPGDEALRKVQVKTARTRSWWVNPKSFEGNPDQVTIYVRLGQDGQSEPVRYFIAANHDLAQYVKPGMSKVSFIKLKAVEPWENRWEVLEL